MNYRLFVVTDQGYCDFDSLTVREKSKLADKMADTVGNTINDYYSAHDFGEKEKRK